MEVRRGGSYFGWGVISQWVQGSIGKGFQRGTDESLAFGVRGPGGEGRGMRRRRRRDVLLLCTRKLTSYHGIGVCSDRDQW